MSKKFKLTLLDPKDLEISQHAKLLAENTQLAISIKQLQKAYVLACRCLADNLDCPSADGDASFPECNGELEECGNNELWKCWQKYFIEKVENEAVCQVCGCTWNNACEGGCYWVEDDLCSKCAANMCITKRK